MSKLDILFFFFNDTATTEIYTLSLHDALPICLKEVTTRIYSPSSARTVSIRLSVEVWPSICVSSLSSCVPSGDRKSTRLNSSHANISYAVFCLKKKNTDHYQ